MYCAVCDTGSSGVSGVEVEGELDGLEDDELNEEFDEEFGVSLVSLSKELSISEFSVLSKFSVVELLSKDEALDEVLLPQATATGVSRMRSAHKSASMALIFFIILS